MRKELFLTILLGMILIFGCSGGGGGGSSSGVDTSRKVSASNIVFSDSSSSANNNSAKAYNAAYTDGVDDSTRILAENVVVDTTGNALTSNNLQDALNNEMAIDLAQLLQGSTWTVANKTSVFPLFSGTSGNITFSNNTIQLNSGKFAAAGLGGGDQLARCGDVISSPVSYEVLSNGVLFVKYTVNSSGYTLQREVIINIIARDKNSLTVLGHGYICNASCGPQLSVLTRNSSAQKASFKPEKKSKSTGTLLVSNKR